MKILYYCMGGGLGHVTRFLAFCHTQNIRPILLTAVDIEKICQIEIPAEKIIVMPRELAENRVAFTDWVHQQFRNEKPDKLIVDSFPGGIMGELCGFDCLKSVDCEYIVRILKLDVYSRRLRGELPAFSRFWQVEKLGKQQDQWLKDYAEFCGASVAELELEYPEAEENSDLAIDNDFWLIIHSGNEDELRVLFEKAQKVAKNEGITPKYVVVGQCTRPDYLPAEVKYCSIYPANSLLKQADKVFSGAGFNLMTQMKSMRYKHICMPFHRALDDQHLRLDLISSF